MLLHTKKMLQYCVTKICEACFVIWFQVGVWFRRHQAYKRWQCTAARNGKSFTDKLCYLCIVLLRSHFFQCRSISIDFWKKIAISIGFDLHTELVGRSVVLNTSGGQPGVTRDRRPTPGNAITGAGFFVCLLASVVGRLSWSLGLQSNTVKKNCCNRYSVSWFSNTLAGFSESSSIA